MSDSTYRNMMYTKMLSQDEYAVENEIMNIQEHIQDIYTTEVDYVIFDALAHEQNYERRIYRIKDWIYLLASNMDDNKDKILTLLHNDRVLLARIKTDLDTETLRLKNTKQLLLKKIKDVTTSDQMITLKNTIKQKK